MEFDISHLPTVREMVSTFPMRVIQLYAPTEENIDEFERFITEVIAPVGITHVTLCIYYKFEYRSHPEIVESPYTTVAVAKRVAAVCKQFGITVVPEIDVPAHQSRIRVDNRPLPQGMVRAYPDMQEPYSEESSTLSVCTRHPRLRPIVFDMIDDLMDAFETTTIHAGFDECFDIGLCPRCKGVPPYILISQLANDINKHIKSRGGEMWMWGDRLLDGYRIPGIVKKYESSLNGTCKAVDLISKDIVICDWHYYEEPMGHLTPSFWVMKGFRYLACPFNSVRGCEQLVHAAYVLAESPCTLGTYLTTWSSLDKFMSLTNAKIDNYKKNGVINQDKSKEESNIQNAGNFADYSSNIFLKMYVRPDGE